MKILLVLLSVTFLLNVDWIKDLNSTIEKINKESIFQKQKSNTIDSLKTLTKLYELNHFNKIELTGEGKFVDTFNFNFFSRGNFVFAKFEFIIAEYLHKGAPYPGRPVGEITETKSYFKNESEGIRYRRTIDYYENSNMDSLMIDLREKKFDTTNIGNDQYLITKRFFKKVVRALKRNTRD